MSYHEGETDGQRLTKALRDLAAANEQMRRSEQKATDAIIAANRLVAERDRLKKRVACGVCPHCQRTFKQLAAHMKTKHPEKLGAG